MPMVVKRDGWHAVGMAGFVVPPDGGQFLNLGNFGARVLATGEQTGGEFSLLQTEREPNGFGPPMHIHHGAAEAFYVLADEYLMFIEGREERCPPGARAIEPLPTRLVIVERRASARRE